MKHLIVFIFLLSLAEPAWSVPIPINFDLAADTFPCGYSAGCELAGSFQYNAALSVTNPDGTANNPIVAWDFHYLNPSLAINGEEWSTSDGGHFIPGGSQSLITTNADNLTLTFQLCADICGGAETYGANVYNNAGLIRYSTSGFFTQNTGAANSASVPEPSSLVLVMIALGMLLSPLRKHYIAFAVFMTIIVTIMFFVFGSPFAQELPVPNGDETVIIEHDDFGNTYAQQPGQAQWRFSPNGTGNYSFQQGLDHWGSVEQSQSGIQQFDNRLDGRYDYTWTPANPPPGVPKDIGIHGGSLRK